GAGGSNSIVPADSGELVTVTGTRTGTLSTGLVGTFANIDGVTGDGSAVVKNGQGAAATWTVNGDASVLAGITFTGVEALRASDDGDEFDINGSNSNFLALTGGAGDDKVVFASGSALTGMIDGGDGNDTIDVTAAGDQYMYFYGDSADNSLGF